ncbi:MAG: DUF4166 domain-containing protein [Pseudomonadota bacterium]
MSRNRILVIGGYGVFGGLLSRRLAAHPDFDVMVGGRTLAKAEAHCRAYGGRPVVCDTSGDIAETIAALQPFVVIDAAGPFQNYGNDPYRVARAAISANAHYLDLADDPGFVVGIGDLDRQAREAGVTVLSGCSSVPAISSAAVDAMAHDIVDLDTIESLISPGNRAPRGNSVIAAILAQVGRPLRVWRGGAWTEDVGWGRLERRAITTPDGRSLGRRWVSPIGAPDLLLFPQHYQARTVRFLAGLELSVMHVGLWASGWLVRFGVLRSLVPLSRTFRRMADWLYRFGSDRGGMCVTVVGRDAAGRWLSRTWTLVAEAGDGPQIPATPAYLLVHRLCDGAVPTGARACIGELALSDIETGLAPFAITTGKNECHIKPLFRTVLGDDFDALPAPLRRLHDVGGTAAFTGRSEVVRGRSFVARSLGWVFGFPPTASDVPVHVMMERIGDQERWTRTFGKASFRSTFVRPAQAKPGDVIERFGCFAFQLKLSVADGRMNFPVERARVFGLIPLPKWLTPVSETSEHVGDDGRAWFDVAVSLPGVGPLVSYRGWLQPAPQSASAGVTTEHSR